MAPNDGVALNGGCRCSSVADPLGGGEGDGCATTQGGGGMPGIPVNVFVGQAESGDYALQTLTGMVGLPVPLSDDTGGGIGNGGGGVGGAVCAQGEIEAFWGNRAQDSGGGETGFPPPNGIQTSSNVEGSSFTVCYTVAFVTPGPTSQPTSPSPTDPPTTGTPSPAPSVSPTTAGSVPTMSAPTHPPTTAEPTTAAPTTAEPTRTTAAPTNPPTTSEPTTPPPTPAPSTSGPTPAPTPSPTTAAPSITDSGGGGGGGTGASSGADGDGDCDGDDCDDDGAVAVVVVIVLLLVVGFGVVGAILWRHKQAQGAHRAAPKLGGLASSNLAFQNVTSGSSTAGPAGAKCTKSRVRADPNLQDGVYDSQTTAAGPGPTPGVYAEVAGGAGNIIYAAPPRAMPNGGGAAGQYGTPQKPDYADPDELHQGQGPSGQIVYTAASVATTGGMADGPTYNTVQMVSTAPTYATPSGKGKMTKTKPPKQQQQGQAPAGRNATLPGLDEVSYDTPSFMLGNVEYAAPAPVGVRSNVYAEVDEIDESGC